MMIDLFICELKGRFDLLERTHRLLEAHLGHGSTRRSRKKQLFMHVSGQASTRARVRAYARLFQRVRTFVIRASPWDHGSR